MVMVKKEKKITIFVRPSRLDVFPRFFKVTERLAMSQRATVDFRIREGSGDLYF